jgi:hypothetical protein
MDFQVNSHNIQVSKDGLKVGSISDSCCNTIIQIKGYKHPVSFLNEVGKGGYISKKLYLMEFIGAFKHILTTPIILERLNKRKIEIPKKDLENNTFLTTLR